MRSIYISIMIMFIAFTVNPVHAYKSKSENNKQAKISNKKNAHMLVAVSPKIDLTPSTTSVAVEVPFTLTGTFSLSVEPKRNIEALELDNPEILLFKKGVEPFNCTTFNWDKSDEDYANQSTKVTCVYKFATPGTYKVNIQYLGNDQYDPAKSNEVTVTVEKYPAPTLNNPRIIYPDPSIQYAFVGDTVKLEFSFDQVSDYSPQFKFQNCTPTSNLRASTPTDSKSNTYPKFSANTEPIGVLKKEECTYTVKESDLCDVIGGCVILGAKVIESTYYNAGSDADAINIPITISTPLTPTITLGDIPDYLEQGQTIILSADVSTIEGLNPVGQKTIDVVKVAPNPADNRLLRSVSSGERFTFEEDGPYTFQAKFTSANNNKFASVNSGTPLSRDVQKPGANYIVAVGGTEIGNTQADLENSKPLLFEKTPGNRWKDNIFEGISGRLNDVSCNAAGSACVAVGKQGIGSTHSIAGLLYMKRTNQPWVLIPLTFTNSSLEKVKCFDQNSKTTCIAVGYYIPYPNPACIDPSMPMPLILINRDVDSNTSNWVTQTIEGTLTRQFACGQLLDIACTRDNSFCGAVGNMYVNGITFQHQPLLISNKSPNNSDTWKLYIDNYFNFLETGFSKIKCGTDSCIVVRDKNWPIFENQIRQNDIAWNWIDIVPHPNGIPRIKGMDCANKDCFITISQENSIHTTDAVVRILGSSINNYPVPGTGANSIYSKVLKCFDSDTIPCIWAGLNNSELSIGTVIFKNSQTVWSWPSSTPTVPTIEMEEIYDLYCFNKDKCMIVGSKIDATEQERKVGIVTNMYSEFWQSENMAFDPIPNGALFAIDGSKQTSISEKKTLKTNHQRKKQK